MEIERIVPDLTVTDLAAAVREHNEVLGLEVVMERHRDSSGRVVNVGAHT